MPEHDCLFVGGRVFDGERFLADAAVGITGDRLSFVGVGRPPAREIRQLAGEILMPAFIDSHTHADFHAINPANDGFSSLSQGVGTLVVGNCGMSATPLVAANPVMLPLPGDHNVAPGEHPTRLHAMPIDIADLMGHGTLRQFVLGAARAPAPAEIARMAGILEDFLAAGGLGLSVGLNYPEANGYTDAELLALCQVLARHGRPLTCHMRDQGAGILGAIDEVLGLGDRTGCPVLISHLRPISNRYDHLMPEIFARLECRPRARMDLYPYAAGCTSLGWFFNHLFKGPPVKAAPFNDDEVAERAREICIGGLEDVYLMRHRTPGVQGHYLGPLARARGVPPGRLAQELYLEDAHCMCIYNHSSSPAVVDAVLSHPKCLIGSDGYLFQTGFQGLCHPRCYAAFTGYLVRYVRAGKVPLEAGLARITSVTADYFSLRDRGRLRVGLKAHLSIFHLDELRERASYDEPTLPSAGLRELVLNGRPVWRAATGLTGDRPGERAIPVPAT